MKTNKKTTIAIGSTNPVKVKAVKQALLPVFPEAEYLSLEVPSGVSDQPKTDLETRTGACNRAKHVLVETKADLGIGLEGGVMETEDGMFSTAWCAIVDPKGTTSFGGGMHFHIPDRIAQEIRKGEELGPLMDKLTGRKNVKRAGGAIEVFTNGLLTRTKGYRRLVELATTKFVSPLFIIKK